VAVCYFVSHCVVVCCNVLQFVAVCCRVGLINPAEICCSRFHSACWGYYGVALVSKIDKSIGLFAKETYKRDDVVQKKPIILSILLTVATPYIYMYRHFCAYSYIYVYIHIHIYAYTHTFIICVYMFRVQEVYFSTA